MNATTPAELLYELELDLGVARQVQFDYPRDQPGARELALAVTNLEQSLLWLRRSLELGEGSRKP